MVKSYTREELLALTPQQLGVLGGMPGTKDVIEELLPECKQHADEISDLIRRGQDITAACDAVGDLPPVVVLCVWNMLMCHRTPEAAEKLIRMVMTDDEIKFIKIAHKHMSRHLLKALDAPIPPHMK